MVSFAPPKLVAGNEWTIPAEVAKNWFGRSAQHAGRRHARPQDAKVAQLTAKVESVKDGRVQIRLIGTFEAVKFYKEQNLSFAAR